MALGFYVALFSSLSTQVAPIIHPRWILFGYYSYPVSKVFFGGVEIGHTTSLCLYLSFYPSCVTLRAGNFLKLYYPINKSYPIKSWLLYLLLEKFWRSFCIQKL